MNLTLYDIQDQSSLLEAIYNEFNCWYKNKIVGLEKKNKFEQLINGIIKNHFKNNTKLANIYSFLSGKYVKVKK